MSDSFGGDNCSTKAKTAKRSTINLLVCSACDHPLCTEDDVLGEKLEMPASSGFAYEFDDVFEDTSLAPWCYRANIDSDVIVDMRRIGSGGGAGAGLRAASSGGLLAIDEDEENEDEDDSESDSYEGNEEGRAHGLSGGGRRIGRRGERGRNSHDQQSSSSSMVTALSRALAPVSDEDTISLMREGIAYVNGTGEVLSTMMPLPARNDGGSGSQVVVDGSGDDNPNTDSAAGSGGSAVAAPSAQEPESPTTQQVRSMLIPNVTSKTSKTNTDLIRVGMSVGSASVVVKPCLRRVKKQKSSNKKRSPLDDWFEGYRVASVVYCASCSASLGWGFEHEPPATEVTVRSMPAVAQQGNATRTATTCTSIPSAVRANPFGPRAPPIFGASSSSSSQQPSSGPSVAHALTSSGVKDERIHSASSSSSSSFAPFICLILKNVKHRVWTAGDLARQCLVSAAAARRQALDLLQSASPSAIASMTSVANGEEDVGEDVAPPRRRRVSSPEPPLQGDDEQQNDDHGYDGTHAARPDGTVVVGAEVAEAIASAAREAARRAEIQSLLDEDVVARKRLEALMNARINEAVEERTRHLKLQAELVVTLLEKHKEQTTVLSQLLRGQKEKLRTQEDKIATYDQIFVAHRRQLETQTKHIAFQDDLMRTLKIQAECQQRQIDSQQTILREQNGTIHKQNHHVREMQGYLKSLVESQVRMKQYLEAISERDAADTPVDIVDENEKHSSSRLCTTLQRTATLENSNSNRNTTEEEAEEVCLRRLEKKAEEKEEKGHHEDTPNGVGHVPLCHVASENSSSSSPRKTVRTRVIAGSVARRMLADLAVHEAEFGIDYSALDANSIAGQAMLLSSSPNPPSPLSPSPTTARGEGNDEEDDATV